MVLDGKVTLPQRHQRFAGIGVLDDQVAAVTGEHPILDGPLRARPDADHIGDINEMVGDRVVAVPASFAGLGHDRGKVAEVGVFQHTGEFACGPEFRARLVDALDAFERFVGGGGGWLFVHEIPSHSSFIAFRVAAHPVLDVKVVAYPTMPVLARNCSRD